MPASVLDFLRIPGLAPGKAAQIHERLGIATLADLEQACRQNRLRDSKGLAAVLQEKVLQGIELLRRSQGQRLIHHAEALLAANLSVAHPELRRIALAGDLRRSCEVVDNLALVAEAPEGKGAHIVPLKVRLWLSNLRRYGVTLLLATGSAAHVRARQTLWGGAMRSVRRRKPCADAARSVSAPYLR